MAAKRSKAVGLTLALVVFVMRPAAQVVVEEEVVTDSVNVFAPVTRSDKSPTLAMVSTVLVPGLGHQYLEKPGRALTYYTLEALCVFGLVYGRTYAKKYAHDARSYAWVYGDVKAGGGADELFWQNVGSYMDSEEYNRTLELNRTPEDKYSPTEQSWRWPDEAYMEHYQQLQETATRWELLGTAFLAGMVLNRVVSFVDVRLASKYRGVRGQARLRVHPHYAPLADAAGVRVSGSF